MNLPGDFHEADGRIQVLSNGVLIERLDAGQGHAILPKVIQGVFQQLSSESVTAVMLADGKVWNEPDAGLAIDPRGDEPRDFFINDCHEDSPRIAADVVVEMSSLPPAPFLRVGGMQTPPDVLID